MKKLLLAILGIVFTFSVVPQTITAHTPVVGIDEIPPLVFETLPQTHTITGFVTHEYDGEEDSKNVCAIEGLRIALDDTVLMITGKPAEVFEWDCEQTTAQWSVDWEITEPGNYTISARALHDENEMVFREVEVIYAPQTSQTGCLAAPAIAVKYLKEMGMETQKFDYGNIVSKVAQKMQPTTEFEDIQACDAEYIQVIKEFVNENLEGVE